MGGLVLRCSTGFSAWGKEYAPGDVVDAAEWPDPTALQTRLQNGFVELGTAPEAAPAPAPKAEASKKHP